ncbi:MAG: MFS transporter [Candidatus Hermodarchaeota archaeon]
MINKSSLFIYFYTYFSADMIFVYTRSYLPIYFSNIIKIDTSQLSFVLFLSYLALLLRPPISIYFDRKDSKRKLLVVLSGFAILVSFSLLTFSLHSTLLFGVLYAILLAFISISTVGVNKIMISQSPDLNSKNRNALLIQIGSISGSLFPIFIFLISVDSSSNWNIFFIMGIIFTSPLLFFIFFLKEKPHDNYQEEKITKNSFNKKPIILICLFLFLAYSDRLFSYSIKPWISTQTDTTFFSILWFILILIYTFGNIIGSIFFKKLNCKKTLLITTFIIGIILFLAPFTNFSFFLVIYGAYFFISGLFLIKLIPYKMELAQNRVFYYQLMTMFSILASVIFIPMGAYFYEFIETEIIIMISGILIILSIIPFYFVKISKEGGYNLIKK